MKHKEFTTRTELKSLTRSIKCVETECGRLRMLGECLGVSSMRLGVPFIAPRQLEVIGGQQGRPKLPFVGWCTGQSGAPPDSQCRWSGADLLPILVQTTVAHSWQLVHRTLSGAHQTVRCPCRPLARATRRPRIARPIVALAAVGSPDSPVNYSRTSPNSPESGLFTGAQPGAPDTVRCTTGQSGVRDQAVLWLYSAKSFAILSFPVSST
jgi:hypothetical protein